MTYSNPYTEMCRLCKRFVQCDLEKTGYFGVGIQVPLLGISMPFPRHGPDGPAMIQRRTRRADTRPWWRAAAQEIVLRNARVLRPTRIAQRTRSAATFGQRSVKPAPLMMMPRAIAMKCVAGRIREINCRKCGRDATGNT